jgi:hypothetical protein
MSNAAPVVEEQKVYVRRKGETRGPISLGQLRRGVESGEVPLDAKVAKAGADEWELVRDFCTRHGIMADVTDARDDAPAPPTTSTARTSAGPWRIATAIGAVLTPLAIVACAVCAWKAHEADVLQSKADMVALQTALADVSAAVRSTTAVTWVHARDTANNCRATNQRFECTVTNATDQPVEACLAGTLAQKKGGGTMRSFPLCTGRIAPRETREISVPWERGSAADICNKLTYGDTRVLDFDACDFDMQPIDPSGTGTTPARTP